MKGGEKPCPLVSLETDAVCAVIQVIKDPSLVPNVPQKGVQCQRSQADAQAAVYGLEECMVAQLLACVPAASGLAYPDEKYIIR